MARLNHLIMVVPGMGGSVLRRVQHVVGDQSNYLRVYMVHLRRKLKPDPSRPRYLLTEPGMGYRFVPDPSTRGGAA